MNNAIADMIPGFIGFIVALNITIFIYQRKMTALYKQVGGLLMEVGAMEFIIRQTEFRLDETNKIAKRMEKVIQELVKGSTCDEGQCDMMIHILKEFKYIREANDVALTRLDKAHKPAITRKERDG